MRALLGAAAAAGVCAFLAAGCGAVDHPAPEASPPAPAAPKAGCTYRAGWQRLANRIGADVYCPGWLPDPLDGHIGAQDNDINSVSKNRSYLESFIWQDTDGPGGGAVHVNLRGYPGQTSIPQCQSFDGKGMTPCFADPHGTVNENGIHATLYTVNQDADQWHLLYAWRHRGSLYAVSEHLAPPLDYDKVVSYLQHELRTLVLIHPST
jgi:hypothetical protein